MPDLPFILRRIAIIGPGLIGGSFGLALRQAGFDGELVGVGEQPYIDQAVRVGAIDRISTLEDAAYQADLCYLSGTVDSILDDLPSLSALVPASCLVTDAGSTKRTITEKANRYFQPGQFLGGHPMAGKEKRGAEHAEAELFRDRPYILTSRPETTHGEAFIYWLHHIGARVVEMSPEQHDTAVAFASHLPQLASTALALTLREQTDLPISDVGGSGLFDMTRLAQSSPELWLSILNTNRDEVVSAIDEYIRTLNQLRESLIDSNLPYMFELANTYAYFLRNKR